MDEIAELVSSAIPSIDGICSPLKIDQSPLLAPSSNNLTVNIRPQIIQKVEGIVAQEIMGDQHLGAEDKEILELISQYGEANKADLSSAVHELADSGISVSERLTAKQKLKKFLFSLSDKASGVAFGVLQKYIENQMDL